jgi:hypothetical protein
MSVEYSGMSYRGAVAARKSARCGRDRSVDVGRRDVGAMSQEIGSPRIAGAMRSVTGNGSCCTSRKYGSRCSPQPYNRRDSMFCSCRAAMTSSAAFGEPASSNA